MGVPLGNRVRAAEPRATPPRTARGERPEALRDVVAARHAVVPWVGPDHHALPDNAWYAGPGGHGKSAQQQCEPGEDERRTAARNSVEAEEHARKDQRRPEILLQEEERDDERHAHDHRPHVSPPRHAEMAQPRP